MAMYAFKLTVSIDNSGITFNTAQQLETPKKRGDVLPDGKVIRGFGTSWANAEAKARYDRLTARANAIRAQFTMRFGRGPMNAVYLVENSGEGEAFAKQFEADAPDIIVTVDEFDFTFKTMSERLLAEWAERNKDTLVRFPFGRAEEASAEGLAALRQFVSSCPVFAQETKDQLLGWVTEAEIGNLKRADLKRNISLLQVKMNASPALAPRSRPTVEPAAEPTPQA